MRIVRPGSVVGPQQQYMYVKQLEWAKWAAVDEMRRAEAQAAAAIAAASIITPATPPAEADDEEEAMEVNTIIDTVAVTRPSTPKSKAIPPVTPSRHVNAATARARAITPPGQPRKTPVAKRTAEVAAVDETDDEESEDEINALPKIDVPPKRTRSKTQSATTTRIIGRRNQPALEQTRPQTRVTRSMATTNGVRKPAAAVAGATATASANRTAGGQSPNKIPRLAQNTGTATALRSNTAMGTRARPTSPTPSRLPTLAASRRNNTANGVPPTTTAKAGAKGKANQSDAWMKTNPSAVVVPGTKSERPELRSIRRRRSSFSAADVIA